MHGEGERDFHPIACSSKRSVGCTNTFSFKTPSTKSDCLLVDLLFQIDLCYHCQFLQATTSEVVPWLIWDIYGRYHAHNCCIYILYSRTYVFYFP